MTSLGAICVSFAVAPPLGQAAPPDVVRVLQTEAVERGSADWGHWGIDPGTYAGWMKHSNRLVPIYTYGVDLREFVGPRSVYRDERALEAIYGCAPTATLNPAAEYCDQTDVFRLQQLAVEHGKKYLVLLILDGADWHLTRAAATVAANKVGYAEGRGAGLRMQDYRHPDTPTDFCWFVTSPRCEGARCDVDSQEVSLLGGKTPGGYDWRRGGVTPWAAPLAPGYLLGAGPVEPHAVTDSAAAATSMTSGVKTYNNALNFDAQGRQTVPLSRLLQQRGWSIGVVTSAPISDATPAAAYANNVHRDDSQDLARDLLGLPSTAHPTRPLPGVDVLLGAGWGERRLTPEEAGANFVPGNPYLTDADLAAIDAARGGSYVVVQRERGVAGSKSVADAAAKAAHEGRRLCGFFGVANGHLPYRTADGRYDPTISAPLVPRALRLSALPVKGFTAGAAEHYAPADVAENPTLADLTRAALTVLGANSRGFWLMVEAGDVDWACHQNNIDNAIGAVLSGDEAFGAIAHWIECHHAWKDAAVIVTSDHGHFFVLDRPEALLSK